MKAIVFFGIGLGWVVALLLPPAASAASDLSLATSPLPISLSAAPGTTVTADLRVKNNGTSPERLKVSLLKFSVGGETGEPQLSEREKGDDYFDWVSFSPSVFDASPGQWQTIKMTVAVPRSAAFGYYLAASFSRATNEKVTGGQQAILIGSTATLVLLEVTSPNTKRSMQAVSFTTEHKFYEFLPATFMVKLHNSGNIHVVPTGNIFITQGKKQIATLDVNSEHGNVLPNSNRIFSTKWSDGFPVYVGKEDNGKTVLKDGKPVMTLKWDFTQIPKLRFGHYTARITMIYNDGKRDVPLEGTVDFWVIPWRVIVLGILVLVVPTSLLIIQRYKYIQLRKRVKKVER